MTVVLDPCSDCGDEYPIADMYSIRPSRNPPEGNREEEFFLCNKCWRRLTGLAMMSALRGF